MFADTGAKPDLDTSSQEYFKPRVALAPSERASPKLMPDGIDDRLGIPWCYSRARHGRAREDEQASKLVGRHYADCKIDDTPRFIRQTDIIPKILMYSEPCGCQDRTRKAPHLRIYSTEKCEHFPLYAPLRLQVWKSSNGTVAATSTQVGRTYENSCILQCSSALKTCTPAFAVHVVHCSSANMKSQICIQLYCTVPTKYSFCSCPD